MEEVTRNDLKIILMFGLHLAMADNDFTLQGKKFLGVFFSGNSGFPKAKKRRLPAGKLALRNTLGNFPARLQRNSLLNFSVRFRVWMGKWMKRK